MPRKTDGEKIDDLEKLVATLVERVDNVRNEMVKKETAASIEVRLGSLEETARRRFSFWPPIVASVIATVLTWLLALAVLKK